MVTSLTACTEFEADKKLLNTSPRITHAGDPWWEGEELHFGVWLQDLDGDGVDLFIDRADGAEVSNILGHGRVGLTATAEYPGTPHELVIEKGELGGTKTLTLTPVDLEGNAGDPVTFDVP